MLSLMAGQTTGRIAFKFSGLTHQGSGVNVKLKKLWNVD